MKTQFRTISSRFEKTCSGKSSRANSTGSKNTRSKATQNIPRQSYPVIHSTIFWSHLQLLHSHGSTHMGQFFNVREYICDVGKCTERSNKRKMMQRHVKQNHSKKLIQGSGYRNVSDVSIQFVQLASENKRGKEVKTFEYPFFYMLFHISVDLALVNSEYALRNWDNVKYHPFS